MHISEGVLSGEVLAAGALAAAAGTAIGLKKLETRRIPEVAVLTAAFFVASLVRVPAGPLPASIHLTLNGLMGLALGWAAFPAILVGLALQALLFQFGGLTVLGVNTTIMAVPAVAAYYLLRPLLDLGGAWTTAGGFLAGALGPALGTAIMALALVMTGESFRELSGLLLAMGSASALVEGTVTAFMAAFILKVRPEILGMPISMETPGKIP